MRFCNRTNLSAYQRRSMRTIETMMGICIALNIILQALLERHHLPLAIRSGMAVLSVAPVITTIIFVARYLRGEKDEYLRNLVVESILWGLGMVLIADTALSYVQFHSALIALGNVSLDVFVVTASITLELKLWRNQ